MKKNLLKGIISPHFMTWFLVHLEAVEFMAVVNLPPPITYLPQK